MKKSIDNNLKKHSNADKLVPVSTGKLTACKTDQAVRLRLGAGEDIDDATLETVHDLLFASVQKYSNRNFLASQKSYHEEWKFCTYKEMYEKCWDVAKSFLALGLERYKAVSLLGFTSSRWFYAYVGAILAGGVGCGIYTTNKAEACHFVLDKSSANIAVVEDRKQLSKILEIWDRLPELKAVVQYTGEVEDDDDRILTWSKFLEVGRTIPDDKLRDVIECQKVNECCQVIFTSGTTGNPKGVLLSHDNITDTARRMAGWAKLEHEIILSYLPLSHIAAQITDIWIALVSGSTVYFAQPDVLKGSLSSTLKEVRPTIFIAVPRVWEKFVNKLQVAYQQQSSIRRRVLELCQYIAWNAVNRKAAGSYSTPFGFSLANAFAFKNIMLEIGLDRCWLTASCAAPLAEETQLCMWKHNVALIEMYGLSETTGPHTACLSSPGSFKYRSVGQTLPGNRTKLAEDGSGEICLWGRNIMMGYLDSPEFTSRAIDQEGWLHTGDLGKLEEDGFLYVTGRIKDLIITAGGENIPSNLIEERIKESIPMISNCILIGDERPFLAVLLTIKCETDNDGITTHRLASSTIAQLRKYGSTASSVHELVSGRDTHFIVAMKAGMERVNSRATSRAQTVRKWSLLPEEFSIASGEIGPTMKMRRSFIVNKYKNLIDSIYSDSLDTKFHVYNIADTVL